MNKSPMFCGYISRSLSNADSGQRYQQSRNRWGAKRSNKFIQLFYSVSWWFVSIACTHSYSFLDTWREIHLENYSFFNLLHEITVRRRIITRITLVITGTRQQIKKQMRFSILEFLMQNLQLWISQVTNVPLLQPFKN